MCGVEFELLFILFSCGSFLWYCCVMRGAVLIIHSDSVVVGEVSGVNLPPTASAKTPLLSIRRGVRTVPQMVSLKLRRFCWVLGSR